MYSVHRSAKFKYVSSCIQCCIREKTTLVGIPKREKRVYNWGNSSLGALGVAKLLSPKRQDHNERLTQSKPYTFTYGDYHKIKIKQIGAGYGFTVFSGTQKSQRKVYGCGLNTDCQIGYREENGRLLDYLIEPQEISIPQLVEDESVITNIACGRAHTVIATENAVYTFGNNAFGQCGYPSTVREKLTFHSHKLDIPNVKKVVCGHDHTLLLTNDGDLYSFGLGTDGQLGQGSYNSVDTPTLINSHGDLSGAKIKEISSRCDTVLAITECGNVFGWGNSEYNQFAMITDEPQVNVPKHLPVEITGKPRKIAAAGTSWCLLTDRSYVYVCGWGILGASPKLTESKQLFELPRPLFGRNEFNPKLSIRDIVAGTTHYAAVTSEGSLYTWGKNTSGVLGLGHRDDQYFPFMVSIGAEVTNVVCGADHMFAQCKLFL